MADDVGRDGQRWMWTVGDYPAIARHLLPISVEVVEAVGIGAGQRVLDVGVGDGNTAIVAAKRGAVVTGVDLTPAQIERARRRTEAEGVSVELREGDAEDLPVDDASFDVVVSVLGAMFAPDHERVAAELARACRPGGSVAFVAWAGEGGWSQVWRTRAAKLVPPAPEGGPQPDAWGDPDEAARRLTVAGLETEVEIRPFHWTFPSTGHTADLFLSSAGPFIAFQQAANDAGHGDEVRDELSAALDEANEATDGTCVLPAPYLLALGRRPRG